MPTMKEAVEHLRERLALHDLHPATALDMETVLEYVKANEIRIDTRIPKVPAETYALEPGKHYVMAYDTAAVSTCMVKALSENLETAGIHVFMVGVRGNPKDAIAFAPTNQTSQATDKEPRRPSVKDTRDAATRIRRGYAEGWFSPDVRSDIGVILYYVEGCLPKQPKEAV